jgi:Fe-S cluster biogenesis protein NfuA
MTLIERIEAALESARPHLAVDGGNVEFVRYEPETGVVEIRFLGACKNCSMSAMTLRAGIERTLRMSVQEVRRVESVS